MDLRSPDSILLISCYELGHQPLGVALPMGFLEQSGFSAVAMDIAVEDFDEQLEAGVSVGILMKLRNGLQVFLVFLKMQNACKIE